jgi:phosphatidylserine decarboxylase
VAVVARKVSRLKRLRTVREDLNFLLTNRIPRRYATLLMGRLSQVRSPRLVRFSVKTWSLFARDLRLDEAEKREFATLRECFTRELKSGARPIDSDQDVLASPCDAIVGAHGRIRGTKVFQAKGFPYDLSELLCDPSLVERHRDGQFVTLRLKASMYHRFHAPCDGRIDTVRYISGDTWNVNPIALSRVEKLFCKNERAVLDLVMDDPAEAVTLVPVAAILVASIKLRFLEHELDLRYKGRNEIPCEASFEKGDELGYFQNGSTIVVFVSGPFALSDGVSQGATIRMGRPLFRRIRH